MRKYTWKEKLQYRFDNMMAKGTVALVGMLFWATAIVIVVMGALLAVLDGNYPSLSDNIWASMMHVIDAGTITAADTGDVTFVILMSIVTLCGIFVTSILIGIITTGFEEKLNDLKKGNSRVIENNHTVILGFNNNVFTLISELVQANENQKDGCIVILSEEEKEVIEERVSQEIPDLKTTRIICRTGSITDVYMLEKCSIETARSIIINEDVDFITIKTMLAINNYFRKQEQGTSIPHMVATITDNDNYKAVEIISEGNAEVLLVQDSISRIIAQTCRQPGLSNVLIELFDYDGDELYFENFPELACKTFETVLNEFEEAVVFGYKRGTKVTINPPKDFILEKDDILILLVEDDGCAKPKSHTPTNIESLKSHEISEDVIEHILMIGENDMVEQIILELDNYFYKGSTILLANETINPELVALNDRLENIILSLHECDTIDRENLEYLTEQDISHVLLLSETECDTETSDAMTLLKLIHLRDIAKQTGRNFNITSEMKDVANQKLADVAKANDLVVGSNIINLILTQISENRDLAIVFRELLQAEGSEIYMRNASNYVKLNQEMDFYEVTQILAERNEIALGYKKQVEDSFEITVNPNKSEKIIFTEGDYIISLSED